MFYHWILALAVALSVTADAAEPELQVAFRATKDGFARSSVAVVGDEVWLQMAPYTPLHAFGKVFTQQDGSLHLATVSPQLTQGRDELGQYQQKSFVWTLQGTNCNVTTSMRVLSTGSVVFSTVFAGAEFSETNSSHPVIAFPSFQLNTRKTASLGYAYWHGLWPQPVVSDNLSSDVFARERPARHDGPVMFSSNKAAGPGGPFVSIVIGPLDQPLSTVFDVRASVSSDEFLSFGPSGEFQKIDNGYCYSVVVVAGPGPTHTMESYGAALKKVRGINGRVTRLSDPFVDRISFWTDNGAVLFWNGDG